MKFELNDADAELATDAVRGELAGDEALAGAARALDAAAALGDAAAAVPGAPGAKLETDWPAEARDLVDFASGMFVPLYPRLAGVWTPERCATLTARLAPVLKKYDLNMEKLLGKWGPDIMLAATVAPLVLPTIKAIKEDNAEARQKAAAAARAAPPADAPPPTPKAPPPMQDAAATSSAAPPADTTKLHERV